MAARRYQNCIWESHLQRQNSCEAGFDELSHVAVRLGQNGTRCGERISVIGIRRLQCGCYPPVRLIFMSGVFRGIANQRGRCLLASFSLMREADAVEEIVQCLCSRVVDEFPTYHLFLFKTYMHLLCNHKSTEVDQTVVPTAIIIWYRRDSGKTIFRNGHKTPSHWLALRDVPESVDIVGFLTDSSADEDEIASRHEEWNGDTGSFLGMEGDCVSFLPNYSHCGNDMYPI